MHWYLCFINSLLRRFVLTGLRLKASSKSRYARPTRTMSKRTKRLLTEKRKSHATGRRDEKQQCNCHWTGENRIAPGRQLLAAIRKHALGIIQNHHPDADTNDGNFVFLTFVTQQLPVGVVGLLMAVIFLAAMGSTASGMNSLASTTVVDFTSGLPGAELNESGAW